MHSVAGLVVVITGAARGMGEIYAQRAVAEGAAKVVLLDVDATALDVAAAALRAAGGSVSSYVVDLSSRTAIESAADRIRAEVGTPHVLINNAGIVRSGYFWEHDAVRDIEATMQINTLAAMYLSRELLPAMIEGGESSRILNIASAAGTLSNPNMSVYAASKWAMIGWSDSLRLELIKAGHAHIAVTTFAPSYISTGMFAGVRGPLWTPIMTPEKATAAAWSAMLRGKPLLMKPWTVGLARGLKGLLPTRAWDFVAGRVFKVYNSMDEFTGR
ncbi:SDR family NAD(P)-dependent oxidoreductase [Salinibacterium sp. SWN139]|uniref:SDR family NAD(P)-dependent oxidoreductase n=1 Tax=Salinibacterium sp. SWN139 TaxID=2792055 RepID=UPI0018CFBE74|nr:SDR family NAD(P)-dependent oxidoreductase [Salinibacterium sp. SWN139]MBH0053137.1 SDR family NAD(P)-dependent oxidoreductase [Salinibacterium sp. SWN139]